jgi:hypothetical protein
VLVLGKHRAVARFLKIFFANFALRLTHGSIFLTMTLSMVEWVRVVSHVEPRSLRLTISELSYSRPTAMLISTLESS